MNKTVVITGTASGFGRDSVQLFAAKGWNVVATVRKESDLRAHQELVNVRSLLLDVNDEAADAAFASSALAQFGSVDALVNNAGYYHMGPVEAGSMEQIHNQFQTNVFGLIALTKAFIPTFRQQRSGVIVNISSISADQGYPYTATYAASKAAVAAFTEGLSVELADFGVSAKAIFPGAHATRIFTKIDQAPEVPSDYLPGIQRFFAMQGGGSKPSVTAQAIFEAVTDGKNHKVRYYTGPDGVAVRRVKQLLGAEWYWEEFQAAANGKPSDLWKSLTPQGTERSSSTFRPHQSHRRRHAAWGEATQAQPARGVQSQVSSARVDDDEPGECLRPLRKIQGLRLTGARPRNRHDDWLASPSGLPSRA